MLIKYFKDYIDLLNEGLIKSHDPEIILNTTLNNLSDYNITGKLFRSNSNNKIIISISDVNIILYSDLENILDIITKNVVNLGGFFVSSVMVENLHNLKNVLKIDIYDIIPNKEYYLNIDITFESKFEKIKINIPHKLYHLTIEEYKKMILKNGLYPKSNSKLSIHSDRIYLCFSIIDCKSLISQMNRFYNMEKDRNLYIYNKKKYKKNTNPIIVEIDNSDYFLKELYIDPNYIGGYFTIDNIPPNKIKIIDF